MDHIRESHASYEGGIELKPGKIAFGRYRIESLLGAGASGVVYKATDLSIANLPVALKVFPRTVANDPLSISRISREIEIAYKIRHQNVVRLFECIRDEHYFGFSMEFVEGDTLHTIMNKQGPLPFEKIARYTYQIASGLGAIHEKGVVHRDIKLENIVITKEGLAKIADFGVAGFSKGLELKNKEVSEIEPDKMSKTSMHNDVVGTLDYIAPEYLEFGRYDKRADIYALGVLMYEMISGRTPFEGVSIPQLVTMKVDMDPKWVVLFRKDCPNELDMVCHHALARDPERRYPNCAEIKADLQKFLSNLHSSQKMSVMESSKYSVSSKTSTGSKLVAKAIRAGRDLALIAGAIGGLIILAEFLQKF